jgi:5-methylcytosine-specific restriction endonuclease McrA
VRAKRYAESPYCYYCERHLEFEEVTLDHYWPIISYPELAQNEDNMILSCYPCNYYKSNADPDGYTPGRFKRMIAMGANSSALMPQLVQYSGSEKPDLVPSP